MKNYIYIGIAVVLGVIAGWVLHVQAPTRIAGAISPAGTTNQNAVVQSIAMAPNTISATSSSILNQSGYDYAVLNSFAVCTGVQQASTSVANWLLQAATTSIANSALQGNANYAANITVSTTTTSAPGGFSYNSTTTPGVMPSVSEFWPNGTYMTYAFNATNTAVCTVGSNVIKL